MFQFPGFPAHGYVFTVRYMVLHHVCSHIRKSADQCLFAAPRSLSQLVTSFIGSWCQGIHSVLLFAWTSIEYPQIFSVLSSLELLCITFYSYLSFIFEFLASAKLFLLPALILSHSCDYGKTWFLNFLIYLVSLYFVCHVWKQISLFRLFGFQWTLIA